MFRSFDILLRDYIIYVLLFIVYLLYFDIKVLYVIGYQVYIIGEGYVCVLCLVGVGCFMVGFLLFPRFFMLVYRYKKTPTKLIVSVLVLFTPRT